ncbi:hypothetical protein C0995_002675 [Termitomyces sp. Mi166|nr:hypothetical protein C0995_002675 [Termitomyces sp. Mi166\
MNPALLEKDHFIYHNTLKQLVKTKLALLSPSKIAQGNLAWSNPIQSFAEPDEKFCHKPFNLNNYQFLPHTYKEVEEGAAVAIIFILGVWSNKNSNNMSFNIQDIVVLADPEEPEPEATSE